MEKSIELDCAPGFARPGDLIGRVVAGTILQDRPEAAPEATTARFFGNWKWEFPGVSDDDWKQIQPTLKKRIVELYNQGQIRYGSW